MSCHLLDTADLVPPREVSFTIPTEGYLREFSISWDIVTWNGDRLSSATVSTDPGVTGLSVDVELPSGGCEEVFLCATPKVTTSGVVLRPMGGWVFPPDEKGKGSLAGGILVSTLLPLADNGVTLTCINVDRMHEQVGAVLSSGYRVIDPQRLEEGLRSGAFRSYHLRGLEENVVTIRELIPNGGIPDLKRWGWYTDDQNDPRCEGIIAGEYVVWAIPVGNGSSRSLWRYDPQFPVSDGRIQRLVVHRSRDGHSGYHVYPVSISQRN